MNTINKRELCDQMREFFIEKSKDMKICILQEELEEIVSVVARCVAHTIQLVAFDVSKKHKSTIHEVRTFVKNVRKSTHNDLFKQAGLKMFFNNYPGFSAAPVLILYL